jgi:hypothetical protein
MMPKAGSSVNVNGVDVENIVNKLNRIDIYTSEDADMKKLIVKETTDFFNGKGGKDYDILMKVKEEKNNVVFYGKKDGNFFTSLVMVVNGDDNCTLIRMLGKFTPQDIQDFTKAAKKDTEK